MICAEDLLTYSKELYEKKCDGEVVLRNSARSAYYALYHKLLDIEIEAMPSPLDSERNYGSHELLIKQLRTSKKHEYRELGVLLATLKSIRNKADYKLERRFSDADAYSTVRKVEKAFEKLSIVEDSQNDAEITTEVVDEVPVLVSEVVKQDKPVCRPTLKVIK
ncbi:hypothetical protein [Vibrio cholerae]|uniref:hypothetical protein n=1 Tax=Vibrio cholerae TaxID=666 RepID=UPI0011DC4A1B|nr:hypothetical protein [Vibrio cholerae]TXX73391.1 hypothetical protein FXE98_03045 [Vibrio cholerae]